MAQDVLRHVLAGHTCSPHLLAPAGGFAKFAMDGLDLCIGERRQLRNRHLRKGRSLPAVGYAGVWMDGRRHDCLLASHQQVEQAADLQIQTRRVLAVLSPEEELGAPPAYDGWRLVHGWPDDRSQARLGLRTVWVNTHHAIAHDNAQP